MRERFRTQVRDDVKAAALAQLAAGGPSAISLNAIAKGLGVSGPALYRYFANRDALLTDLVLDAYSDLADVLDAAEPTLPTLATAYRGWALAQPHRYRLLFSAPTPGFDPHDPALVAMARRCMPPVVQALGEEDLDSPVAARMWARMHGLVDLEIEGNWASMAIDPAALYAAEFGT